MPHCMVPECTNNSRKATGASYHRIPKDTSLRQAWMARIRRVNPRNVDHSFVRSAHFTPDCFEETPANLVAGYRRRPRLRPNSVPSVFPHSKPETPRTTGQKREQIRTKQAKQEMLQDCLEQVSSVTGEQCQIESPEPFQRFLEPRTLPLEESFQSDIDIPTADQTTREEVGIQCELLVSKNLPMVKSVSIQAEIQSRPTFVTVATQTDIQNQPTLESVHTQTTATDVSMPITSEIVSPQKSICSELTCTSTDIDSVDDDDDMYMPVSAESQTESDNESDNDPVKSVVEQQKFIVFQENLSLISFLSCVLPVPNPQQRSWQHGGSSLIMC